VITAFLFQSRYLCRASPDSLKCRFGHWHTKEFCIKK
jgi:hypothetical protein